MGYEIAKKGVKIEKEFVGNILENAHVKMYWVKFIILRIGVIPF